MHIFSRLAKISLSICLVSGILVPSTCIANEYTYKNLPYFRVNYYPPQPPKFTKIERQNEVKQAPNKIAEKKTLTNEEKSNNNEILASIIQEDRRETIRFDIDKCKVPISVKCNNDDLKIKNISRGGLAIASENLTSNEEIPLEITYRNMKINTKAQILSNNKGIVSSKFMPENTKEENELLLLSILLENDNQALLTKLSNN